MPVFANHHPSGAFSVGDWRGGAGKVGGECTRLGYRLGGVGARGGGSTDRDHNQINQLLSFSPFVIDQLYQKCSEIGNFFRKKKNDWAVTRKRNLLNVGDGDKSEELGCQRARRMTCGYKGGQRETMELSSW